jgi:hypothetical protein
MSPPNYAALFDEATGPAIARQLLVQIFTQAVLDGRQTHYPPLSRQALAWLNCPHTAELALIIELRIPTLRSGPRKLRTATPKPYRPRKAKGGVTP